MFRKIFRISLKGKLVLYGLVGAILVGFSNDLLHYKYYLNHPEIIQNRALHVLVSLGYMFVFCAPLFWYVSKRIIGPIKKIVEADQKIAMGLTEGKYLDPKTLPDNEIKEIVLSRNQVLQQLDCQQQELEFKNEKLTRINSTVHHMMKFLVSSHFDQPGLKKSVEILCSLVDARYGVALTYNERGEITAFASNLPVEDEQKIGRLPSGPGILGIKLKKGEVLNSEDLTKHPLFTGFPPHHPVVKSLLVVPIWVQSQYFGKIYLSDKKNGERFTAADEELVVTFANGLALAAESNRLLKALQKAEELYRITVNSLPIGLVVVDRNNQVILANKKLYRIYWN